MTPLRAALLWCSGALGAFGLDVAVHHGDVLSAFQLWCVAIVLMVYAATGRGLFRRQNTMIRLTNTLPGHNKFWEIDVMGKRVDVRFGAIGSRGQMKSWNFQTEDDAAQFGEDKLNEKLAKGYVQVSGPQVARS